MSDWKKTVLSDEQIWVESVRNSEWTEKRIRKEIALAQAKPAYEQGLADAEAISTQMAYEAGKEQGRKEERAEIVEWVNRFVEMSEEDKAIWQRKWGVV